MVIDHHGGNWLVANVVVSRQRRHKGLKAVCDVSQSGIAQNNVSEPIGRYINRFVVVPERTLALILLGWRSNGVIRVNGRMQDQ